jgi:hypothetical protein
LVEVVVILSVLAILAAIAVPVAFRIFQVAAEDTTREEMTNLKNAIIGDPRKLQSSFRSDFGFLGDIGCMPAVLDRLLTIGALPAWSFDAAKQSGAGWKGPYITGATVGQEVEEFTKDQWGNNYTYSVPAGPCPLTATLASNGPDGKPATADDITLSIVAGETTATVRGKVKDTSGVGLESVPVEFYAPVNGVLTTTAATTDANGEYAVASVPYGARAASGKPRLVFVPGSVTRSGNGRDITFVVHNFSEANYTVTQMRADYGGGANYDVIRINGATVDSTNNMTTGQVVNVTWTTIAAAPAARPSMRVYVDSSDAQLPDITVSGQATTATIDYNAFNTSVAGVAFKVTFNPAGARSVVVFSVPP